MLVTVDQGELVDRIATSLSKAVLKHPLLPEEEFNRVFYVKVGGIPVMGTILAEVYSHYHQQISPLVEQSVEDLVDRMSTAMSVEEVDDNEDADLLLYIQQGQGKAWRAARKLGKDGKPFYLNMAEWLTEQSQRRMDKDDSIQP